MNNSGTIARMTKQFPGGYWSHKEPAKYATHMMLRCIRHYQKGGLPAFLWDAIGYASR